MNPERDRVISISLTESEWQAFVARHPEPVEWIRARIKHESGTDESGLDESTEAVRVA